MLLQSRQFCPLAVSSLQSLLREPLLIANMSVGRAIAGSKHAGSPQTCQAASKPRPLPALSAALRSKDYARKCSERAWDCGGFCNLWLQNAPHKAVQFQSLCECSVSSLQSLGSELLLIANMSVERAIAGSKHAGSPQTCQAASKPRPLPALSAALRSKDYAKNFLNGLALVVASAIYGCKTLHMRQCSSKAGVSAQSVSSSLSYASRYSSQTCRWNEPLRAPNMLAHHKHARPPANHGRYQR